MLRSVLKARQHLILHFERIVDHPKVVGTRDHEISHVKLAWRRESGSLEASAFVESNRAIAVSSIHVFIRLAPAFEVEDWYVRSGGRRHLLSMIRSRWGTGR